MSAYYPGVPQCSVPIALRPPNDSTKMCLWICLRYKVREMFGRHAMWSDPQPRTAGAMSAAASKCFPPRIGKGLWRKECASAQPPRSRRRRPPSRSGSPSHGSPAEPSRLWTANRKWRVRPPGSRVRYDASSRASRSWESQRSGRLSSTSPRRRMRPSARHLTAPICWGEPTCTSYIGATPCGSRILP